MDIQLIKFQLIGLMAVWWVITFIPVLIIVKKGLRRIYDNWSVWSSDRVRYEMNKMSRKLNILFVVFFCVLIGLAMINGF